MKVWAFDTETFLIQPSKHVPRAVSLAWDYGAGPQLVHCVLERQRFRSVVEEGLEADLLVGANVAYDLAVIAREFPDLLGKIWKAYDENRVWDIEHTEKLCDLHDGKLWWHWDPTHFNKKTKKLGAMVKVSYSLAAIVFRRFGITLDKDTWRLLYGTLANTPCHLWPQGARDYALLDASITYRVWAAQAAEPFSKLVDLSRQAKAGWWIHRMTCRGFRVDPVQVEKLSVSIRTEREHVAARLKDAGLVRANGTKDKKAAEARMRAVCAAKNLELQYTPKGKVKISKETASDTKDPVLLDFARLSSLTSMISGSILTLQAAARAGMPIQSRFEVLQETGRTSCSGSRKAKKGQNPYEIAYSIQLQNVRRGILDEDGEEQEGVRECFVPRDGFVLASIDFGQLELCCWAQVCIDLDCGSALADALNSGVDVHALLGSRLFGVEYEWVVANKKKDHRAAEIRQAGKPYSFGLPGGMGAKGIVKYAKASYGVIVTELEAKGHIEKWKSLWPEQEKFFRFIRNCVGPAEEGAIVQVRSWRRRGGASYTSAANTTFQGLASDMFKESGYEVLRCCDLGEDSEGRKYPVLRGSFIVNEIHDELVMELPIDRASEAAAAVVEIMERVGKKWCPDVPPKAEPALMERWTKGAGPKYENGKLVVWRAA